MRALRRWSPLQWAVALLTVVGCAQAGEFINLTFDDPDLSHARYFQPPIGGYDHPRWFAPVQEAFRGLIVGGGLVWAPYQGVVEVDSDGGAPFGLESRGTPPFGAFGVSVNDTYLGGLIVRPEFTLAQVGRIPDQPSALVFYQPLGGPSRENPIQVFVNGGSEPVVLLYGNWATDVSAFAGQEVELKFLFPVGQVYGFDIFGFTPVPEPSACALLALGGGALLASRRRRKSGSKLPLWM